MILCVLRSVFRGISCVVTAKIKELWEPYGSVTAEDVEHMRNRFEEFPALVKIPGATRISEKKKKFDTAMTFAPTRRQSHCRKDTRTHFYVSRQVTQRTTKMIPRLSLSLYMYIFLYTHCSWKTLANSAKFRVARSRG